MQTNPFTELSDKLEAINERLEAQPNGPVNEWLTADQAADYLHVSKSWIYKRTMNNQIPFHKPSKKLMFRRSELDNFISKARATNEHQGVTIEK